MNIELNLLHLNLPNQIIRFTGTRELNFNYLKKKQDKSGDIEQQCYQTVYCR